MKPYVCCRGWTKYIGNVMFFKTSPTSQEAPKNETQKEEKPEPKRSFKEVMATRQMPQFPSKRNNIFDLASKGNKKSKPQEKKKETEHTSHSPVQKKEGPSQAQTEELSSLIEVKSLSLEMRALMNKMADFIQMESNNGISTTTVSVEMEEGLSAFNGSEIRIDHYDTAPHSFNIELSGNPEAVDIFAQHLASLQTALQERLEHFHVELLPPVLSGKMEPFETRKKARKKHMRTEKVRER